MSQIDSSGIRPSMAMNAEGTVHIGFFVFDPDSARVMHASWDDAHQGFVVETIHSDWTSPTTRGPHPQAAVAIDLNGHPHFVYHSHSDRGDPFHSYYDGTDWINEEIPTDGHDGFSTGIAIDSAGLLHVSFVDGVDERSPKSPGIEYTFYNGSEWVTESIGSERFLSHFTGTSIALDMQGVPNICYYDSVRHDLMLAKKNSATWSISTIDSIGDTGRFASLVFGADGLPNIAYLKWLSESLGVVRIARWEEQGWVLFDVDTLAFMNVDRDGRHNRPEGVISLHVSETGISTVAYSDTKVVKIATIVGRTITIETIIDLTGSDRILGQTASLAVDSQGEPHVAFYEDLGDSNGVCFYASHDVVPPTPRIPCEAIMVFNAKCGPEGQAQIIARMEGNWSGVTVTFDLDGQDYFSTVASSGINSIAKLTVPDIGPGLHTAMLEMSTEDRVSCAAPVSFSCSGDALVDPEWDALLQEYDAMVASSAQNTDPPDTKTIARQDVRLVGNYPNPFNPSTTIRYTMNADGPVSIRVYNMLGQEVTTLVDEVQRAGEHSVVWNGSNKFGQLVASGLYLCTLQAGSVVQTLRMVYLK